MSSLSHEKKELRDRIRSAMRKMDPEERRQADERICRRVSLLRPFELADTIFCFIGVDWEVNTRPLVESALGLGKKIAVPLCTSLGIMEARWIQDFSDLQSGAYGIPEPRLSCPICPPECIDFAIVPCVSCDKNGMRLGQGGGYYDRFLEHTVFDTAALCREAALLPVIRAEPWDHPVDYVVTEKRVYTRKS